METDLDENAIANYLATYLRVEPAARPFNMPNEDFCKMLKCCAKKLSRGAQCDASLMDVCGSIFAICLHIAIVPKPDEFSLTEAVCLIQTVLCEALVVIESQENDYLDIVQPSEYLDCKDMDEIGMLETFSDALDLAKSLLRDATHQIRTSREKPAPGESTKISSQQKVPTDCFQPHSLYFMCSLAIAHVAAVLHASKKLSTVPGLVESLAIMAFVLPSEKCVAKYTAEARRREEDKAHSSCEPSRFLQCFGLSSTLSLVVMNKVFDEQTLKEIRLLRSKMLRKSIHPDVSFARIRMEVFREFTALEIVEGSQKPLESFENRTFRRTCAGEIRCYLLLCEYVIISSGADAVAKLLESKHHHTSTVGEWIDEDDVPNLHRQQKPQKSLGVKNVTTDDPAEFNWDAINNLTRRKGYLQTLRGDFLRKGSRSERSAEIRAVQKNVPRISNDEPFPEEEIAKFLSVKRHLRGIFAATCSLRIKRQAHAYHFPSSHAKSKAPGLGIHIRQSIVSNVEMLEELHSNCDAYYCPSNSVTNDGRHLDPTQPIYWICTYVVECLYQKTIRGEGFSLPVEAKVNDLKTRVKNLHDDRVQRKTRTTGMDASSTSSYSSDSSSLRFVKTDKSKLAKGTKLLHNVTNSQVRGHSHLPSAQENLMSLSLVSAGEGDLLNRLKLAKEEALLESKLLKLEVQRDHSQRNTEILECLRKTEDVLHSGISLVRRLEEHHHQHDFDRGLTDLITPDNFGKNHHAFPQVMITASNSQEDSHENISAVGKHGRGLKLVQRTHLETKAEATDSRGETLELRAEDPKFKEIEKFCSSLKKAKIVEPRWDDAEELRKGSGISVVWSSPPLQKHKEDETVSFNLVLALQNDAALREASRRYAEVILKAKKIAAEEREDAANAMRDQQELEISAGRLRIQKKTQEEENAKKRDEIESMEIKQKYKQFEKQRIQEEKLRLQQQKKIDLENEQLERRRIADIRQAANEVAYGERMQREEREAMERIRQKAIADSKEFFEIIRRNAEENAMKLCEQQRKQIEDKKAQEWLQSEEAKTKRLDEIHLGISKATARVRSGAFHWHNGKFSFYDDIRPKPVAWYQYEDAYGNPYYYDRLTNKTQYKMPTDAPIRHYTEDIRDEYDAIHGAGAYDAMMAEKAFKKSVNENQGWYDEDGVWIAATGYYDDNGEWVQYEGYYDDDGTFRKYAKVTGNLSFMV